MVNNIKIVQALDKLRTNNYYVHNDLFDGLSFETPDLHKRKVYLVETLATINALVENGTMLLYGGHGGGKTTLAKYLGQIFCHFSADEIEDCFLRCHPQLTEEKILGSLDIAQLTGNRKLTDEKHIDVHWSKFIESPWKIIDELNRLSPYAQNILLSLLAEGTVKYHNSSLRLPTYSVYATMNPKDEGNFSLSLPFLDRFAMALPITMPDYESLLTIGKKNKRLSNDSLTNYLPGFDLAECQEEVLKIRVADEAEYFIDLIIAEYRLCLRCKKESIDEMTLEKLCKDCRLVETSKVCNKIINPLSVRVKEDLYKYGRAIAWFLGSDHVSSYHIQKIAPFFIWHRSNIKNTFKESQFKSQVEKQVITTNQRLDATTHIIEEIANDFSYLKNVQAKYNRAKRGDLNEKEFKALCNEVNNPNQNHLLIQIEMKDTLNNVYNPIYKDLLIINNQIKEARSVEDLQKISRSISFNYDLPNRQFLIETIEKKINKLNSETYSPKIYRLPQEQFYEEIAIRQQDIHKRLKSIFRDNFSPEGMKPYQLFSAAEDGFDLKMTKSLNDLKFEYRGPQNSSIIEFLERNQIGESITI